MAQTLKSRNIKKKTKPKKRRRKSTKKRKIAVAMTAGKSTWKLLKLRNRPKRPKSSCPRKSSQ